MAEPVSHDSADETFAAHRRLLFSIAYELTGSVADAEDVVQEAWLRWREVDHDQVRNPRAYLARTSARLALNQLRSVARRRETYVGPWLPEPLLTTSDVADDVLLGEAVSTAMLVVLDTLGPDERAVFVLNELFGFAHGEIAEAIGKSPAAVRQIAHRAREHVHARRPALGQRQPDDARLADVLQRFAAATTGGDIQGLMDVLSPDVVLITDGGGRKSAALRPIHGPKKVAGFLIGLQRYKLAGSVIRAEFRVVNASPGALVYIDDVLDSVFTIEVDTSGLSTIFVVRNPDKLNGLTREHRLSR